MPPRRWVRVSGRCSAAPGAAGGPHVAGSRRGSEDSGGAGRPCVSGCGWWGWSSGWTPSHISDTRGASRLAHKHSTSHSKAQDTQAVSIKLCSLDFFRVGHLTHLVTRGTINDSTHYLISFNRWFAPTDTIFDLKTFQKLAVNLNT